MATRTLVTGASGLIGRQVVALADELGEVIAVSRSPQDDEGRFRWLRCDLSEPGATTELVESVRPDVVIHLAGAVRGDRALDAVAPTVRTNLVATVELLEAATRLGCSRIVLSGSLLEEPATGGPSAVPPSPYGASRWAASAYGRMFHALFDTPVVILRPSYAYGPGQERSKLVPYVITALLAGERPQLSRGEPLIDWVYAEDVARAYMCAATVAGAEGHTLDIGSGMTATVGDVVQTLIALLGPTAGRPEIGAIPVRPLEQQVTPDLDTAAAVLGW